MQTRHGKYDTAVRIAGNFEAVMTSTTPKEGEYNGEEAYRCRRVELFRQAKNLMNGGVQHNMPTQSGNRLWQQITDGCTGTDGWQVSTSEQGCNWLTGSERTVA